MNLILESLAIAAWHIYGEGLEPSYIWTLANMEAFYFQI
jgi:hypothetical protein